MGIQPAPAPIDNEESAMPSVLSSTAAFFRYSSRSFLSFSYFFDRGVAKEL